MISIISDNFADYIESRSLYRRHQIEQLALYYNQYLPCPPVLIAYGLANTAKLRTITALFEYNQLRHAVVKSRECLSQRHLLGKIFAECIRSLHKEDTIERYDRVDSLNALSVNLRKLFMEGSDRLVLVIDGIDKQRGASHTLLPALARLADIIPGLTIVFIISSHRPLQLHRSGVPYIHFPPYSREEAIQITLQNPPPLQPENLPADFSTVSNAILSTTYNAFVNVVYDALTTHVASTSLPSFRRSCEKLWPWFVWPMLSGETVNDGSQNSTPAHAWNFARLLVRNRPLFQKLGEKALTEKLSSKTSEPWTFDQLIKQHEQQKYNEHDVSGQEKHASGSGTSANMPKEYSTVSSPKITTVSIPLLKFFPTLLLVSAYLASHGPPKHDIILFSRLSSSSSHKRKYLSSALNKTRNLKSPRVRKTPTKSKSKNNTGADASDRMDTDVFPANSSQPQTPSKKSNPVAAMESEKTHKSSRLHFEKTSSIPRPFTLERVIAILRAIHPEGLSRTKGAADRVYGEMVDLERLRLVVRLGTSASAGGGVAGGVSAAAVAGSSNSGTGFPQGGTGTSSGGGGFYGGAARGTTMASTASAGGSGSGGKGSDDGILEEKWRVNIARDVVIELGKEWGISLDGWEID